MSSVSHRTDSGATLWKSKLHHYPNPGGGGLPLVIICGFMQSLDGLAIELLKHGYRRVLYFELSCSDHGDFRSAYEPNGEFQPACPRCGRPAEAATLAEGFTRRETIPWERVSRPLPAAYKGRDVDKAPDWHAPRGRPRDPKPTQHRIVLLAFLALRGASRQAMAEQLGVRKGTANAFVWRNAAAIEHERERLRSLPESARRTAVEQARSQIGKGMTPKPQNFAAAAPGAS